MLPAADWVLGSVNLLLLQLVPWQALSLACRRHQAVALVMAAVAAAAATLTMPAALIAQLTVAANAVGAASPPAAGVQVLLS